MRTVITFVVSLTTTLILFSASTAAGQTKSTQMLSEENQVRNAVESLYVKGLITRDFELIRKICVPEAKLMGATERGTLNVTTLDKWSARFDPDNPPFETIDYCISKVDVVGAAAQVKIIFIVNSRTEVTDFLNMLEVQGAWRIVNIIDY